MPHFVIDCSEDILWMKAGEEILKAVHFIAESTG